ncbi:MAG: HAD-IB family hydrolase [Acidimicrobiia bacterium]
MAAAAFFDLDKTIIARSSTLAFASHLNRAGLLNKRVLLKAAFAQSYYRMFGADHDQLERIREELGEMTRGWDRAQIVAIIEETVDEVVSPLVYAEALFLIDDHHRHGRPVIIISSSPVEIVEPLGRFLGADEVIGTVSAVDDQGRYTGALEFYAYGEGKATAIRRIAEEREFDLAASFAYSDSVTDLPMLEIVGYPVAVNPDKELKAIAIERGWSILEFERAVTLRTRLETIPAPIPLISGATLVAAVAAGLAVWALRSRRRLAG